MLSNQWVYLFRLYFLSRLHKVYFNTRATVRRRRHGHQFSRKPLYFRCPKYDSLLRKPHIRLTFPYKFWKIFQRSESYLAFPQIESYLGLPPPEIKGFSGHRWQQPNFFCGLWCGYPMGTLRLTSKSAMPPFKTWVKISLVLKSFLVLAPFSLNTKLTWAGMRSWNL